MVSPGDRVAGGLLGLLIGDALGVPYEFHAPEQIPPCEQIEMKPPAGFRRAHPGVPPGTWSDDGAQALCLLESLLLKGRLDVDHLGRCLLDWYQNGHLAVDGAVFDVGSQTAVALDRIRAGAAADGAGPAGERDNGNGSLMRVLPLALWHRGSDAALAADAMAQSRVTHGHLRAQLCCALYCLWARRALEGAADPWADAVAGARSLFAPGSPAREQLDLHIAPPGAGALSGRGSGYVVDCLHSAVSCLARGRGFEHVVRSAIALGNDTDTTAAVAGGLAGLAHGLTGIPQRWVSALRGQETARSLLALLLSHRAARPGSPT